MKPYLPTIIFWSLVAALGVQLHGALFAYLTVPFVLIYLVACLFFLAFEKRSLKHVGITLSVITISYLVIASVHFIRFKEARIAADLLAAKVQEYKARHGAYPASGLEVGLSPGQLKAHRIFYELTANGPVLFYPATQVPFDMYFFNFGQSKWEYQAD